MLKYALNTLMLNKLCLKMLVFSTIFLGKQMRCSHMLSESISKHL